VWDDVLEVERGRIDACGLRLERTRPAASARVIIDSDQLAQVFVNLLVNALDAAPDQSTIALTSELHPTLWHCRITNGGPPIPPDQLGRVFEVFFSTKPGGTGIGLALCQRIVEEHGGSIGITSSAQDGTTVTVSLPRAP
jgi:signal transduction histidine kinase